MAGEVGQVAEVVRQEDDRVLVALPMQGFPDGFRLESGDRVVVVHGESGPEVRPLVHAVTVDQPPTVAAEELEVGAERYRLQDAAIRNESDAGAPYNVWVVDRADDEPGQVIAYGPQTR